MISKEDGKRLLNLARNSIKTYFSDSYPDTSNVEQMDSERGLFVTLHKNKELRGCIGFPKPIMPLYKAIIDSARSAAFKDPRFSPLEENELEKIHIEISILTVPELIEVDSPEEYNKKIEIGKHGLIIEHPLGSGLLLPQVPVEQNWDVEEYLKYIAMKAGLPEDILKDKKTRLYSFEAQIFSE